MIFIFKDILVKASICGGEKSKKGGVIPDSLQTMARFSFLRGESCEDI